MIDLIYKKLEKYATPGLIISGLILVVVFNLILFPGFSKLFDVTIPLQNIPDLKFSYSPNELNGFFKELGGKGRKVYLLSEILVDLSYMIMYTLLYSILIIRLFKINRIFSKQWLISFPLLLGFFDLLENTGIVILLLQYPERINELVHITSFFTSLKWIFALFTFLTIVLLSLLWLFRRLKRV